MFSAVFEANPDPKSLQPRQLSAVANRTRESRSQMQVADPSNLPPPRFSEKSQRFYETRKINLRVSGRPSGIKKKTQAFTMVQTNSEAEIAVPLVVSQQFVHPGRRISSRISKFRSQIQVASPGRKSRSLIPRIYPPQIWPKKALICDFFN